ncbi:MAG: hypothetical protein K9J25_12145 [Bacteroidales bacterium]|nr:hypothetical protein [Bacteroidales bacterium]
MTDENYIIDKNGRRIAVQIPIKRYKKLVTDSEELDEIREYRKAKSQKRDPIPFDQAFREIEDALE